MPRTPLTPDTTRSSLAPGSESWSDDGLILRHAETLRRHGDAVECRIDPALGHPEAFRIERSGAGVEVVANHLPPWPARSTQDVEITHDSGALCW
jgi:hypothetical protein